MLFVHIGTHKTGSTSIQQALREARGALRAEGWQRLSRPAALDAGFMAAAAFDQPRAQRLRRQLARATALAAALASARATARSTGPRPARWLLSWEGFSGLPQRGYTNAGALAAMLCEATRAFDTRLVVYLRRQDDFVESMYTQAIQEGAALGFDEFLRGFDEPAALDYEQFVEAYACRFGHERVLVRVHGADGGRGAVDDFGRALGIAALQDGRWRRHENRAMSRTALEIARCANPLLDRCQRRRLREALQAASPKGPGGFGFFRPEQRERFLERYAASNARLAARLHGPGAAPLFSPPRPAACNEGAPGIGPGSIAPILVALLNEAPRRAGWPGLGRRVIQAMRA